METELTIHGEPFWILFWSMVAIAVGATTLYWVAKQRRIRARLSLVASMATVCVGAGTIAPFALIGWAGTWRYVVETALGALFLVAGAISLVLAVLTFRRISRTKTIDVLVGEAVNAVIGGEFELLTLVVEDLLDQLDAARLLSLGDVWQIAMATTHGQSAWSGKVVKRVSDAVMEHVAQRSEMEAMAREAAKGAKIIRRRAAIVYGRDAHLALDPLAKRGVRVIVTVAGSKLRLMRAPGETTRADHPEIVRVFEDAGEQIGRHGDGGWTVDADACAWRPRDSMRRSKVDPEALLMTAAGALRPLWLELPARWMVATRGLIQRFSRKPFGLG